MAAKGLIGLFRPSIDALVDRFEPLYQEPAELTILLTFSFFYSLKSSKAFSDSLSKAVAESLKHWKPKANASQSAESIVTISLNKMITTYETARKRERNPVKDIFESFFKDGLMRAKGFKENPFFHVDAKRAINNFIEKEAISSLYLYEFPDEELVYPVPKVFMNLNKAKTLRLANNEGGSDNFYVAQIIEKNRSTYFCLLENEKDTPFIIRAIKKPDGGLGVEFISDALFTELYNIYAENVTIFSAYDSPLY